MATFDTATLQHHELANLQPQGAVRCCNLAASELATLQHHDTATLQPLPGKTPGSLTRFSLSGEVIGLVKPLTLGGFEAFATDDCGQLAYVGKGATRHEAEALIKRARLARACPPCASPRATA